MSEGHTPGPWRGTCEIVGASRVVATVAWCSGMKDEDDANARLIAAAPDLLAACKAALGAFEHNHAIDWSELERAIAKATGAAVSE